MNTAQNTPADNDRPVSAKTGNPFLFEAQVCGRCGGGGHYSFNMMHGSTCYGCNGHGIKLTKRGAAAQAYYTLLLSKRTIDLVVGDKVLYQGFSAGTYTMPSGWMPVERKPHIKADGRVDVICTGLTMCGESAEEMHRVAATADERRLAKRLALDYQAQLTKTGKPRKRRG